MPDSSPRSTLRHPGVALGLCSLLVGCAGLPSAPPRAVVATSPTAQAMQGLPRSAHRPAVTVYEMRSNVALVEGRAATDMFKTALVHSGRFRVVERARLNEGVMREKQLACRQPGGRSPAVALAEADYVFEAAVSEANASETQRSVALGVGGLQMDAGSNRDSLAIDVRIVASGSGEVIDVVRVIKPIPSDQVSLAGVGRLIGLVRARQGKDTPYQPELAVQQQRREGVDAALRAAIDEAVLQLARRFQP